MFTHLVIFPLIRALPFDFGQLCVIDAFFVPVGILTEEITPAAISFLILAGGAVVFLLAILDVGGLHNKLISEKSGMVCLLSSALEFVGVVDTCL